MVLTRREILIKWFGEDLTGKKLDGDLRPDTQVQQAQVAGEQALGLPLPGLRASSTAADHEGD